MITISLDEQGVFENNKDSSGNLVMIAGIVYDDKNDSYDVAREKSRIRKYFELVCQEAGADYPSGLHVDGSNFNKVRQVKTEYSRTLGEFLQKAEYKGEIVPSADGKGRFGCYYVYALIKSRKGKAELIRTEVSNLINENNASNLYMHMVEDVLARLLFYNQEFLEQESVSFDLATRVYVGARGTDVSEHTDIGYRARSARNGEIVYLTNADVFRTALERDMLTEEENDIDVKSLTADSIDYADAEAGHEFLYMADAVCTCLGFENDYGTNKPYLNKTWERMKGLAGDNRLLFSYDEVDTKYIRAWRMAADGDIYKALSIAYDTFHSESEAAGFYKQVWAEALHTQIAKKADASTFTMAIRKYAQSTRNNNINQEKQVYIFEELEKVAMRVSFSNNQDKAILYELYDSGVSAYNHIGDQDKARACLEKCREYARFIGIEREIRNRNKLVVGLCDTFRYQEAAKIANISYECYHNLQDIQKKLFGEEALCNSLEFGIVCSQMAQVYSYMCDKRAEEFFHKALELMEKGTADYYITESYLLHYYLQMKEKDNYETYAKEFFGGKTDLEEQFTYLVTAGSVMKNPVISLKFALCVYLKSIDIFYVEEMPEELVRRLSHISEAIKAIDENGLAQMNGHPWELNYKYLASIMHKRKQFVAANYYTKKIDTCLSRKGSILEVISLLSEAEVSLLRSPGNDIRQKIDVICDKIAEINPKLESMERSLESIKAVMTYMYR